MLCITFDNFGCGSGKLPACPFPDVVPVEEWNNYNELGLKLGHPRILNLLERLDIRTTFFAEGYSAVLHPEEMLRWRDQGHEIALHGWKHETWSDVASERKEDQLVQLAVAAVEALLGEPPVGFRPPGLRINYWTDAVMRRHGIRYIAQSTQTSLDRRFAAFGVDSPENVDLVVSRGNLLPCNPQLIDGLLISPAYGGLLGRLDAQSAYDEFFRMAVEHERLDVNQPWVFTAHPMFSGNRAWSGFERFMRRLHSEFGSGGFRLARELAFDDCAIEE
jgi:hypothetical protein